MLSSLRLVRRLTRRLEQKKVVLFTALQYSLPSASCSSSSFKVGKVGDWYKLDDDTVSALLIKEKLPKNYARQVETFLECSFMVRKPFLQLKECMDSLWEGKPAMRVVLYGDQGSGKTTALTQALHYGYENNWILVHVPSVIDWNYNFQEISMSTWVPGKIDLPLESAEWLQHFKSRNQNMMQVLDGLKTSKEYKWSTRDITPEGSPLTEIIDTGIQRVKFSSDCVGALLRELRLKASEEGKIKLLICIDEGNSLFHSTYIRREDKSFAPATDVSLNIHFARCCESDWKNGLIILTVDKKELEVDELREHDMYIYRKNWILINDFKERMLKASPLPHFLLGPENFNRLDPFLSISVEKYTPTELNSCLDYYFSKNWIQTPGASSVEGRKQLAFLSDHNPGLLERICASW